MLIKPKSSFCLVLFLLVITSFTNAQNLKDFSLEEIWGSSTFLPKSINSLYSMNDGQHYTSMVSEKKKSFIIEYEYLSGKAVDTLFSTGWPSIPNKDKFNFSSYSISNDEQKILLAADEEPIYRRSSKANYFIYDFKDKSITTLSDSGKQTDAYFSPDGLKVVFVRENNIFIKDLVSKKEIQVTFDGKKNEIINGHADWVYEEEFEIEQALYWSADGSRLAYYKFDERKVKEFYMAIYGNLYPEDYRYKYPKAGEDNSKVEVYIYDLSANVSVKAQLDKETDQYIPRVQWTNDPKLLAVQRMNRLQNHLELLLVNEKGESKNILTEDSKTYIDVSNDLYFLGDNKQFIWSSSKDGFNHLYLYKMDGKPVKQITKGKWDVIKLSGVNDAKKLLYYQSSEVSPLEKHVYSILLDGTDKKRITPNKGSNDVIFSKGFSYYIITHSNATTPTSYTLFARDGQQLKTLEDNGELKEKLKQYNISAKKFFNFKIPSGGNLNGWMIKPSNFDSTKKYPVLMFVYGGPGSQTVVDSWDARNGLWYQHLAQNGYIVVSVDNRGTGARGDEFKKCTYLQLGKLETEDQTETAKYLASLSFIDSKRIGIQGWSYGGYMTSLCLTKSSDVFKMGIAVAPVTNWKFYDSIYTERYLRTPQQNQKGYDDNSPINFAAGLKGKFLLIHGTADDNVHLQNSMEFVSALVKANKPFDSFFYPNKNHSIYGGNTRLHLYSKMTDFILKNL
jgi:dipeptidyl-peptidase 4